MIALLIGEPLAQRIHVPKQYQVAVTNLFDHPSAQQLDVGRYLRYNLVVGQGWRTGVGDAHAILDGTYPWNQYGFSWDDEGNMEGPDCQIIDHGWDLLDPRGHPTLDPKANVEVWGEEYAFDSFVPKRGDAHVEIRITVLARNRRSLLKKLKRIDLGWNLSQSKETKQRPTIELTHETHSGRAILSEPEPGLLLCRIVPTDRHDPERMLALVIGALHRWLQDEAHSIMIDYVRKPPPSAARGVRSRKGAKKQIRS